MIYEIKNEKLTAKINTLGAELISCVGIDGHEYIYQTSPIWLGQAKNLFPNVGQIKDNFVKIGGEEYPLHQHGFAKDMEFALKEKKEKYISFVLKSDKKTKKYLPYDFELYINFELNEEILTQTYKVVNLDQKQIYFGIGSHTGFIAAKGSYLDFHSNCNLMEIERKDMMYLTGKCSKYNIDNAVMALGENTYNNGANILTGFSEKKITLRTINDPHFVTVDFTDFSYLGLWAPANSQIAISIMPWCALPDEEITNHNFEEKTGNIVLKKDETFTVKQNIQFGIE